MSAPMTVGELIKRQQQIDPSLPVVFEIASEGGGINQSTFISNPDVVVQHGRQTYLGDIDVARIRFTADEP
jgi:hypothetical protein